MKKILLVVLSILVVSLFGFAQNSTSTSTSTPASTSTPTSTTTPSKGPKLDLACIKTAIEKREDALKTARENYFSKISQAYDERKTALSNAWSIENNKERNKAIQSAWLNFRKAVKNTWAEYKKAHAQIWKQFVSDRKNCGSGPTGENPGFDLSF
ncbi:MAG: hypothetical protein KatS3mg095_0463 [Candidatus Parcubacteria bacterium]|nr:MAG: hypothetical protein KatS3mg095_0463 [Candidatus Parcubacteria bacterium]